jgi:hypothetical protein
LGFCWLCMACIGGRALLHGFSFFFLRGKP